MAAQLKPRECPLGFTASELAEMMTPEELATFNYWMRGSTRAVCDGQFYDHIRRTYFPSGCYSNPHGVVTYTSDVNRFLLGMDQDD